MRAHPMTRAQSYLRYPGSLVGKRRSKSSWISRYRQTCPRNIKDISWDTTLNDTFRYNDISTEANEIL